MSEDGLYIHYSSFAELTRQRSPWCELPRRLFEMDIVRTCGKASLKRWTLSKEADEERSTPYLPKQRTPCLQYLR
jgi:hypothetical protein